MDFNHNSNPINPGESKKVANLLSTNGHALNNLQKAVAEIQNAPIDAIPDPAQQNHVPAPKKTFDPEFIFECADNDDDGSGKLIAQLLQDQFKYDHTAGRWLKYKNGIWLDDKDETAKKTARELCKNLFLQAYKFFANESITARRE